MNPAIFAGVIVALLATSRAAGDQQPVTPLSPGAVAAVIIWTIIGPAFLFELGSLIEALAAGRWGEAFVALGFSLATSAVLFPSARDRL